MSQVIPFHFGPHDLRVVDDGAGNFEAIAQDVVQCLGAAWQGNSTLAHVPEEWKGLQTVSSPTGSQELVTLKEPGLYFYLGRSDRPAALPMQKWVNGEVLPSIRRTGTFTAPAAISPLQATIEAARALPSLTRAARLLGCDRNAAVIAANQAIYGLTQINLMKQLGHTHLKAERQDCLWFTPTELGLRIGSSARSTNLLLAAAGLQDRIGEVWQPTEAGREFCRLFDTGKKQGAGVPVTQVKWSSDVLGKLGKSSEVP